MGKYLRAKMMKGKRYLYLMESVFDEEKGKRVNRFIQSYGRYENAPEEIRRQYEQRRDEKEQKKQRTMEQIEEFLRELRAERGLDGGTTAPDPKVEEERRLKQLFESSYGGGVYSFGHILLRRIWAEDLGFGLPELEHLDSCELLKKLGHVAQGKDAIDSWSLSSLLYYFASKQLIRPDTYVNLATYRQANIYHPWLHVPTGCYEDVLDHMLEFKDALFNHAANSYVAKRGDPGRVAALRCFGLKEWIVRGCGWIPMSMSMVLAVDEHGFVLDAEIFDTESSPTRCCDEVAARVRSNFGIEHFYYVTNGSGKARSDDVYELVSEYKLTQMRKYLSIHKDTLKLMVCAFNFEDHTSAYKECFTGHCYVSVLGLMLQRVLMDRLEAINVDMGSERLRSVLSNLTMTALLRMKGGDILYRRIFLPGSITPQMKELFPMDEAAIFKVLGLSQIPLDISLSNLKRNLALDDVPKHEMIHMPELVDL